MLTQREKLEILMEKIKKHDFFEGPYMISRKEANVILCSLEHHYKRLTYGHGRYEDHKEEINQRSKERYQANKEEIKERKKQRRKELQVKRIMEDRNARNENY